MGTRNRGAATGNSDVGAGRGVVFIGPSDPACRSAVEQFARGTEGRSVTLCDSRPDLVEPWARALGEHVSVSALDPGDHHALCAAVEAAALVVLGAPPCPRVTAAVRAACIDMKVPYLDLHGDVESTRSALATLARRAEEAGVPLFIGCGAFPGMNNVLVVDAARELDSVETIDMLWTSSEQSRADRPAVERLLSAATAAPAHHGPPSGPGVGARADLGGGDGAYTEQRAHPARITMPRRFPAAARIRTAGRPGSGLLVRVAGTYDGDPAVVIRRTPGGGEGVTPLGNATVLAGTACAAFVTLALDRAAQWKGALAPEDWADPEAFYTAMENVGVHPADIVETVV
ncbi:hypothetical protein ACFVU3_21125 [Streptomyces sp. NPDC058052]|uniref:hypothetical protein n=1 Tax=Streptomyces sp. NPDC058052 TaxID=3346316 RepID=UPI0036E1CA90